MCKIFLDKIRPPMKISLLQVKIKQANMNVREVCQMAHITTPTFYEMIKRNNTSALHLENLAKVLKFPVQDLFDDEVKAPTFTNIESLVQDPSATYSPKAASVKHVGKLIEERMKRIKFTIKDMADATNTTSQNISQMLGRKSIAFDKAVEINAMLNPPGSPPWDIFSYYSRATAKSVEQRYVELLEEHKQLQGNYLKLLEKCKVESD